MTVIYLHIKPEVVFVVVHSFKDDPRFSQK